MTDEKKTAPPSGNKVSFQGEGPPAKPISGTILSDIPGRIALHIGTGKHAQSNIVYSIVLWSFIAGSVLSGIAALHMFCDPDYDFVEKCKGIWSIFVPLITLSVGYLFGKRAE